MRARFERVGAAMGRAVAAALKGGATTLAAGLTYYALLSLFPTLIVVVALLALVGQTSASHLFISLLEQIAPASAVDAIRGPIAGVVAQKSSAGVLVSAGAVIALVAASAYVGAFIWAVERVYPVSKSPSFPRRLVRQVLFAVIIVVLLAVLAVIVVVSGPVARVVADATGLGDSLLAAYQVARWPVMAAAAVLLFLVLYLAAPDVQRRGVLHALPGAVLGVAVWVVASVVFDLYVTHLGRYGATYGTLAGVVVFLLWLWILNVSLLLGAQFNAQLGKLPPRG
jgi:membrane protein